MKKRVSALLISGLLFIGASSNFIYAANEYNIEINNQAYVTEKAAFLWEDSIYLPLREIGEKIGYEVKWNGQDKSIDLIRNEENVRIFLENKKILLNGKENSLVHLPHLKDGNTYTSVDFFGNYLDNIVSLNNGYEKIAIDEKKDVKEDFLKFLLMKS